MWSFSRRRKHQPSVVHTRHRVEKLQEKGRGHVFCMRAFLSLTVERITEGAGFVLLGGVNASAAGAYCHSKRVHREHPTCKGTLTLAQSLKKKCCLIDSFSSVQVTFGAINEIPGQRMFSKTPIAASCSMSQVAQESPQNCYKRLSYQKSVIQEEDENPPSAPPGLYQIELKHILSKENLRKQAE